MDEGGGILKQKMQQMKNLAKLLVKQMLRAILMSPFTWIALVFGALVIVVVGAFMGEADYDGGSGSGSGSNSGYTAIGQTGGSSDSLVNIAKSLHDYIRTNNYSYSCSTNVSSGYTNQCYNCGGLSAFEKNTFEQFNSIRCIDCSAYVSWVLNTYLGDTVFSTRWASPNFGNQSKWPSTWKKININDIQPGDILWKSGHVGIYIGDGKTVEAGCTDAIREEYSHGSLQSVTSTYTFGIRIP